MSDQASWILNRLLNGVDELFAAGWYTLAKHLSIAALSIDLGIVGLKPGIIKPSHILFFQKYTYIFLVSGILFTILNYIEEWRLKSRYKQTLRSPKALTLLINCLNMAVDTKVNRFSSLLREFRKKESYQSGEVFKAVTKPQKQLKELTGAIHKFFEFLVHGENKQDIKFETSLLAIDNNTKLPIKSIYHVPGVDPPVRIYNDITSIVSHAIQKKKTIIVDDIAREKQKKESERCISKYCTTDHGSAICFPIKCEHTGEIPLAIRIVATGKFFLKNNIDTYETIFKHFRIRLLVENALKEFSENAK